jgi:hypothetical protein
MTFVFASAPAELRRLLQAKDSNVRFAHQQTFRVVPEIDPADPTLNFDFTALRVQAPDDATTGLVNRPHYAAQIEDLFNLACDRGDGVLENADPELRREVQELLAQKSGGQILDQAAFDLSAHYRFWEGSDNIVGVGLPQPV